MFMRARSTNAAVAPHSYEAQFLFSLQRSIPATPQDRHGSIPDQQGSRDENQEPFRADEKCGNSEEDESDRSAGRFKFCAHAATPQLVFCEVNFSASSEIIA
jgi:hypothetical protein